MSVTIPTLIVFAASSVAAGWLPARALLVVAAGGDGAQQTARTATAGAASIRIHGTQPSIGHGVPPHSESGHPSGRSGRSLLNSR